MHHMVNHLANHVANHLANHPVNHLEFIVNTFNLPSTNHLTCCWLTGSGATCGPTSRWAAQALRRGVCGWKWGVGVASNGEGLRCLVTIQGCWLINSWLSIVDYSWLINYIWLIVVDS